MLRIRPRRRRRRRMTPQTRHHHSTSKVQSCTRNRGFGKSHTTQLIPYHPPFRRPRYTFAHADTAQPFPSAGAGAYVHPSLPANQPTNQTTNRPPNVRETGSITRLPAWSQDVRVMVGERKKEGRKEKGQKQAEERGRKRRKPTVIASLSSFSTQYTSSAPSNRERV